MTDPLAPRKVTMPEPSLSEVHADLVGRLKHDERLRHVEQQVAVLSTIPEAMQRMETRLVTAITDNKPKSPWPAVGALGGVLGVLVVVFAAIYGQA